MGYLSIHKWIFFAKKNRHQAEHLPTYRYLKNPEMNPKMNAHDKAIMRIAGIAAKDALTKNATMEPKGMRMSETIT